MLTSAHVESVKARIYLEELLEIFPSQQNSFTSYAGEASQLRTLAETLRTVGWREVPGSNAPTCIFLDVTLQELDADINRLNDVGIPAFIVLNVENSRTKKLLLPRLETMSYQLFKELGTLLFFYRPRNTIRSLDPETTLLDPRVDAWIKSNWSRIKKFQKETVVEHLLLDGHELLLPRRFDIALKAHYARLYLANAARSWREEVYYHQALRITGPGEEINEHGSSKRGLRAFLDEFNNLLEDIDPVALPAIPVDKDWVAQDGSHRIASAIAKKREARCLKLDTTSTMNVSSMFFQSTSHEHAPIPEEVMDEGALEYCRIKNSARIALIFPCVKSSEGAEKALEESSQVVYRKKIFLTPDAGGGVLVQAYQGHPWLSQQSKKPGFQSKKEACFPASGDLRVILLDQIDMAKLRDTKEHIRSYYGLGNHSLHITDSAQETLMMARALFNKNSLDLLKIGVNMSEKFETRLFEYRDWLEVNRIDEEQVCIDGSFLLELLNLRQSRDLDFIYHGDSKVLPNAPTGINCHNSQIHLHGNSAADITGDPRLHGWYMGVKFITPEGLRTMKSTRGENKDKTDIILINVATRKVSQSPQFFTNLVQTVDLFVSRLFSKGKRLLKKVNRKFKIRLRN